MPTEGELYKAVITDTKLTPAGWQMYNEAVSLSHLLTRISCVIFIHRNSRKSEEDNMTDVWNETKCHNCSDCIPGCGDIFMKQKEYTEKPNSSCTILLLDCY